MPHDQAQLATELADSRNSIQTGTYFSIAVLPGESASEFQDVERRFVADLGPQGLTERAMVNELAPIFWKKLRLEKVEYDLYVREINRPLRLFEMNAVGFYPLVELEWVLGELEVIAPDRLPQHQASRRLQQCLKPPYKATISDLQQLQESYPDLCQRLLDEASEYYCPDDTNSLIALRFGDEEGNEVYATQYVIEDKVLEMAGLLVKACGDYDSYRDAYERVRSRRMLEIMQKNELARPTEYFNKAFYQTLVELRKQQGWAKINRVIDVTLDGADT